MEGSRMKQSMKQQNQKEGAEPKQQTGRDKRMRAETYATEKNARVYLKKIFFKRGFQITEMVSQTYSGNIVKKGIRFLGLVMLLAGTLFPRLFFLDCVHAVMPEAAGVESGAADPDKDSREAGKGTEKETEEGAQNQPRELTGEDYERLFDPGREEYRISFRFLN